LATGLALLSVQGRTTVPELPALQAWLENPLSLLTTNTSAPRGPSDAILALLRFGRADAAQALLAAWREQAPEDLEGAITASALHLELGDATAALAALDPVVAAGRARADCELLRARALAALDRRAEAIAAVEAACAARPNLPHPRVALAWLRLSVDPHAEVVSLLQEAVLRLPPRARATWTAAWREGRGEPEQPAEETPLASHFPAVAHALTLQARDSFDAARFDQASDLLDAATLLDPKAPEAWLGLARLAARREDWSSTALALEQGLQNGLDWAVAAAHPELAPVLTYPRILDYRGK
jgi:tetratricopeptide (TPR) repeat protein